MAVVLDHDHRAIPEERNAVPLADLGVIDLSTAQLPRPETRVPPVLAQSP